MTVKYEQVISVRCDLVYEVREDESGDCLKVLKRCCPHNGQCLYEIKAAYDNGRPPCCYYILGTSMRNARKQFRATYTWLDIVSIETIPPGERANKILTNPLLMPLR